MAINPVSAELLMLSRRLTPEAADVLMLGRQWLRLKQREAAGLRQRHGIDLSEFADDEGSDRHFAEPLFERLGFRRVDSMDAAAYQGANLIHDLNTPVAGELHQRYDWIFDGGTLEHVFHLPEASTSIAGMLRNGGLFISMTPCNNWMGHGLYQFSPELWFRLYSPERGFTCRLAALFEHDSGQFHALQDPASSGRRHAFNPPGRLSMLLVAQKTGDPQTQQLPAQSDYAATWAGKAPTQQASSTGTGRMAKECLPRWLTAPIRQWRIDRRRRREARPQGPTYRNLTELWKHNLPS
jgi:hypothetical protein